MENANYYIPIFFGLTVLVSGWVARPAPDPNIHSSFALQDTLSQDTTRRDTTQESSLPPTQPNFEETYRYGDPYSTPGGYSPFVLDDPTDIAVDVEMREDSSLNFTVQEKIGEVDYRAPTEMSYEEFQQYQNRRMLREYWESKSRGMDGESAVSGRQLIPPIYISPAFDRIFGGSYVDIRPNGFVALDFGARFQRIDNPSIPIRQQRNGGFEFDQQISMNVTGRVGEKLAITANFDNNNTFDFENDLRVEYTGYEEDIIKKIEIGNVSMPIRNSLITGGQNLFGFKTELQFGKLFVTGVASTQRGTSESIVIEQGVQKREFEIRASDYEENKHFFLGHFFRNRYEQWMQGTPNIVSQVNINRLEVYVINRNNDTETLRSLVALMDLGEGERVYQIGNPNVGGLQGDVPTDNAANTLYQNLLNLNNRNVDEISSLLENQFNFSKSIDFEKVNGARKLSDREYFLNPQLGIISLTRKLQNDEVLAVAYEYTYQGRVYKVGELTEDYQNFDENQVMYLKMLRPSKINIRDQAGRLIPTWDLMMKNIYYLQTSQIERNGFQLRVIYRDDRTGLDNPSLHEGINLKDQPLLRVMGLDKLNLNNDPVAGGDGNFDFVEDLTIYPETGQIIIPRLEPFGDNLEEEFVLPEEQNLVEKFVYDTLYNTTKADAELVADKNKYFLVGELSSGASNEIILPGINVSPGSVTVLAGGVPLTEGTDYTVDYSLGRIQIVNEGVLQSGKKITINYEKADLFNFQARTLLGTRAEYRFNEDINLGGTMLYLNERPLITRVSIGDEPTRNTLWGLDLNYRKESRFLTKLVDAIPLISTKEMSVTSLNAEFAQLLPGTSNIVDGEGTSYIDDFEAAVTPFNVGSNLRSWKLAATPFTEDDRYDLSEESGTVLGLGYKRARLAWYIIDNIFYRDNSRGNVPGDIDTENFYTRAYQPQDIFLQQDEQIVNANLPLFEMAYFPEERGSYNYNPDLTDEGLLKNPRSNWGGISRAISTDVDFDKTNIEYIEFWLLDPFIEGENGRVLDGRLNTNNTTGGKLIFNLGSVSEDIIKDERHGFENGLPADGDTTETIRTAWGRVTRQQFLTNAFDNSPAARVNQDIGFDGLKSSEEADFHSDYIGSLPPGVVANAEVYQSILSDASNDDFQYYLGPDQDAAGASIIERYKEFNNTEGNTPVLENNTLDFTPSGTNIPDNEDLNNNNTLSEVEEYYEYEIPLRRDQLVVGQNYIVDEVTTPGTNGDATWYLFRIPVRQPTNNVNSITGFKTIRYIRTYLTDWQQPVVLRMANFRLVGSQWRRYTGNLFERGLNEYPEDYDPGFIISVVNREENSQGSDNSIPYVEPPGIRRDRDNTSTIERRLNEQALQLCVDELREKDSRAAFKNVNFDLVNYGRIKMFFHASSESANDSSLTAYLRLGTDFDENYYEIEIPLVMTPFTVTPGDQRAIWPLENEIDLNMNELFALKSERNRQGADITIPFSRRVGKYRLTVEGRPDISAVQTLMIGIRNPASPDGASHSVCVWANELRVTDFNTVAGWAVNATANAKLADFANVSASVRHSTFGFGPLQSRIAERTREETTNFDISANVNLDKFTPEKWGIKIPMFASYEKGRSTPFFDPLDPDIPLEASLLSIQNDEARRDYEDIVIDQYTRRSINFTNVRKIKTNPEARNHFWDIENFSFSFAASEMKRTNYQLAEYKQLSHRAGIGYNYSLQPVSIEPFKNVGFLKSKWLSLIRDFNFSPIPTSFGFRFDGDRQFQKTWFRNDTLTTDGVIPLYEKYFRFNRSYNLQWQLTKSLNISYNARANAIIDEPEGELDTSEKRDSVWTNIKRLGRLQHFAQDVTVNYRVPWDKIPILDWFNTDLLYSVGYNWRSGPITQLDANGDPVPNTLGNIIENYRNLSVSGKVDLVKLYNKSKWLNDINRPSRRRAASSRSRSRARADTVEQEVPRENKLLKGLARLAMSVRSISGNYSQNEGTMLSGFLPKPFLFGLDSSFNAPGAGFIFGSQDPNIRFKAVENRWLTSDTLLTTPFSQSRTTDLRLTALVEPFSDFTVNLDIQKNVMDSYQELFRNDVSSGYNFISLNATRTGSYSISYLSLKTSFSRDRDNNVSPIFETFVENRDRIIERLNDLRPGSERADTSSQDVLIPAFIAAYSGADVNSVNLTPFPNTPLPNWTVSYKGFSKLKAFQEIFQSFTIRHGYRSKYNVDSYTSSLVYGDSAQFVEALSLQNRIENYTPTANTIENPTTGGILPLFVINQISIVEAFTPLIGIDFRTRSRWSGKIEMQKRRDVVLNLSNTQVTELKSTDITFEFGITKSDITLPIRAKGRSIVLDNDLTFNVGVTFRDSKTIQRKINDVNTVTNGNLNIQIKPNINYQLNERLSLRAYFERTINDPKVSNSFKRTNTAAGVQVRFSLAE